MTHRHHLWSVSTCLIATALVLCLTPAPAGADTLTVSQWGDGYPTINDAIDAAVDGDLISVEMGIYTEDVDFDGKNVAVVSVSGPTVTSILGNTTAVRVDSGESEDAQLDGFTVSSNGTQGIYIADASPLIRDCIITDSTSYAAYVYYLGNPTFEDCTFENNSGSYPVYVYYYAAATFTGCTFQDNTAQHGGALYVSTYSDAVVDDCTFLNNSATNWGGTIHTYRSTLALTDSHFEGNSGYYGNVAVYESNGPVVVRDNVFFDNTAEFGGVFYLHNSDTYVSDNQLVENTANADGGAFFITTGDRSTILNNTAVGNIAYGSGGGVYAASSVNVLLANNIFAHATNGEGIYTVDSTSRLQLVHNDVYDHSDGAYGGYFADPTGRHGNQEVDPGFVAYSRNGDLADDDLTLAVGSALIDAGAPDFEDVDGTVSDVGWGGGNDLQAIPNGYDWVVSRLGNGDFVTIAEAVAVAGHGDRILVYPGLYQEDVNTGGADVEIDSLAGPEVSAIVGSSTSVRADSGETAARVDGFTMWAGSHAVYVTDAEIEFVDCWFRYNYSYSAYVYYLGDATFTGCLFEENSGTYPNYIYYYAAATFDGCTFRDNSAQHAGGVYVSTHSEMWIEGCLFDGNYASTWGGAIHAYQSLLEVHDSTFTDNYGYYGIISPYQMTYPVVIDGNTFAGNSAEYGGALYNYSGTGRFTHNVVNGNSAEYGGALYLDSGSHLLVANNTMVANAASSAGGGIWSTSSNGVAVVNNIIAHGADGEGVYSDYAAESTRMWLSHNDVYDNYNGDYGGALVDPTGSRGNLSVSPQFAGFVDDGDPNNDDLTLSLVSDLVDAGATAVPDDDGTRSDIGAYGGDYDGDVAGADYVVSQLGDGDYRTIAEAVAAGGNADLIVVQPGVYQETVDYDAKDLTVRSTLGVDVTFIGGSSGGVVWTSGEDEGATLEDMSVWTGGGTALNIQGSSPTISRCRILYSTNYAAYVYYDGNPLFEDTEFYRNSGTYPVYVYYYTAARFSGCTFRENSAQHGGAFYVSTYSDASVEGCNFVDNYASNWGGAIHGYLSDLDVSDSTFTGNYGYYGVVSLYSMHGDDYFHRNTFCGNSAEFGGALYLYDVTSGYFGNNIFQDNHADSLGGGVYADASDPSFINNTFVENEAPNDGGGHMFLDGAITISSTNNIFAWASDGDGLYLDGGVTYTMLYSDFWENTDTDFDGQIATIPAGNYAVDPLFNAYSADGNCANDDLTLAEGSPLIDAGNPALLDEDGSPSDVGAYGGGGPPNPDYDHDGYGVLDGDCDNFDDEVYPGAPEIADGIDNDCDGLVDEDTYAYDDDGDGYAEADGDCDDADPNVNPGAAEDCNGIDDDCDGDVDEGVIETFYRDVDGDGYGIAGDTVEGCSPPAGYAAQGGDCDDADAAINPGASEVCNGVDDDCDGVADDGLAVYTYWPDGDGDGYGDPAGAVETGCAPPAGYVNNNDDCNDAVAAINPGAIEVACDGIDNDCDGDQHLEDVDDDGDGFTECGGDCDDIDGATYPGATEVCDGADNDCDGVADDGLATFTYYTDGDGDGYGDPAGPTVVDCSPPEGFSENAGDCDDADAAVHPGAVEQCDNIDNDCNGQVDDGVGFQDYYPDADGDGYGDPAGTPMNECSPPPGYVDDATDCNDADAAVNPAAVEIACDGIDNDCDGVAHAEDQDDDGDGFSECGGDCDDTDPAVNPTDDDGDGASECAGDCDDADADLNLADADADGVNSCDGDCDDDDDTVYPGAAEVCNGEDDDCDGTVPAWEIDGDGDGVATCGGDCDDSDAMTYPGAPEQCDGLDNDCDGVADEDVGVDQDGDGFTPCDGDCHDGEAAVYPGAMEICDGLDSDCDGTVPADEVDADADGWRICDGDCDDGDAEVNPGAPEVCNGVDDDCDPATDENVDGDGDGVTVCAGDCDDADTDTYPGAMELCDGIDNDCDGAVDPLELDGDGDGWRGCQGDCDDADDTIYPGAPELCDGIDNDCDGTVDEGTEIDDDGDGVHECDGDCDDADANTYPGAAELCDGIDNNCNGVVPADELDADADGWAPCDGDCDDTEPAANPAELEDCFDGIDNDCDGFTDLADDECAGDDDDDDDDDDDTVGDDDDDDTVGDDDDDDTVGDDDDDTVGDDDDDDTVGDDDDDDTVSDDDDDTVGDDDDTTSDIPGDDDDTGDLESEGGCECASATGAHHPAVWLILLSMIAVAVRRSTT